jgi:hypothetical protein
MVNSKAGTALNSQPNGLRRSPGTRETASSPPGALRTTQEPERGLLAKRPHTLSYGSSLFLLRNTATRKETKLTPTQQRVPAAIEASRQSAKDDGGGGDTILGPFRHDARCPWAKPRGLLDHDSSSPPGEHHGVPSPFPEGLAKPCPPPHTFERSLHSPLHRPFFDPHQNPELSPPRLPHRPEFTWSSRVGDRDKKGPHMFPSQWGDDGEGVGEGHVGRPCASGGVWGR